MKRHILPLLAAGLLPTLGMAAINVPGADGSDGVLNITGNTVIDLSQAVTGNWDDPVAPADMGKGVYDASKWAVVFKYSSVTIASGVTLSFSNHPSRAPVVWLVSGDVTIEGTVSLNGADRAATPHLAEPGPGGFRGGIGYYTSGVAGSAGLGPAGGGRGQGGSYGTSGDGGIPPFGNPSLIPLIGGSGGGGDYNQYPGGGAGGGALLIASTGQVLCTGTIRSNGGAGRNNYSEASGGGSGGGIRIVCDTLAGAGTVQTLAGGGHVGGLGRIRLERATNTSSITVTPDPSVVPLTGGDTALLWPPSDAPSVRVVSIGGEIAPTDPRASFGTEGADVSLAETTTTQVVIETTNVEAASVVTVRIAPRSNADATSVIAAFDAELSADPLVIRWLADVPTMNGYSAIQVKVVRP